MASIYGRFEYGDDTLVPGQSDGGGLSQLLFDSEGKLADHATFFPDDNGRVLADDDSAPASGEDQGEADAASLLVLAVLAASTAVAVGGYVAVRKAAPHIQRMINEHALPAVKSFWNRVRGRHSKQIESEVTEAANNLAEIPKLIVDSEVRVGTEVEVPEPAMSAEEWYARFRTMLTAQAIADEQWRALSSARVVDDEAVPALQAEMARHSLSDVLKRATVVIESTTEAYENLTDSDDWLVKERYPITLANQPNWLPHRAAVDSPSATAGD